MKTYRVGITGGRDHEITQEERIEFLNLLHGRFQALHAESQEVIRLVVLHGNARGVDQRAAQLSEEWGYPTVPFEAPWEALKKLLGEDDPRWKVAGHLRNGMMLAAADLLIAFPGGRGTADCVRQAEKKGIEVVRVGGGG